MYNSPGLNLAGTSPTRTFPDMLQILSDNTNAKTGRCECTVPAVDRRVRADVPQDMRECFSEFLPTTDWLRLPRRPHDDVPDDRA